MPAWIWKYLINSEGITEEEKNRVAEVYHKEGKDLIYGQAKERKVLPFAANTMINLDMDTEFWNSVLCDFRERNDSILEALNEAYSALRRHGVKKMFVSENFGALLSSGNDIGLFASGDVDNYADPCEKDKIYHAFEDLGYSRKERYSGMHQIAAEFFPPASKEELPDGFYISVDFYPLARLKLPCFIEADSFVDWSKVGCYKDTVIALPPPTALMYICLLHISLHSFSRSPDIRLYVDLLNLVHEQIDFTQIAEWCHRDHTCTRAATAADICNSLFGCRFPESVIGMSGRKDRLKRLVFDAETGDLIYQPRPLKVLRIETACDDYNDFHGLMSIFSPEKAWMKAVYGGYGVAAHVKHFFKVI